MKTVALIPIKLNNERIPGKNTKPLYDGTPLMNFIQHSCLNSKRINETYVYCSDESVQDFILPGVKFLKRPKELDLDTANSNTIIAEFIKTVDADYYIETHATCPFTKSETLDTCIEKVMSGEFDSAFCAEKIRTFIWSEGKPLNFDVQHFPRTQDLPPIFAEGAGAFVFSKETFVTYGRRVGINPYIHETDRIEAMDVDYPIDFDMINAVYKNIIKGEIDK